MVSKLDTISADLELLPKLGRSENLDHDGPSFYMELRINLIRSWKYAPGWHELLGRVDSKNVSQVGSRFMEDCC